MTKKLILFTFILVIFSCDGGRVNYNNPNIPNFPVNIQLNLNLPQCSNLQYASNHIIVDGGARGIVVFYTGSSYLAYDLACPNQSFSTCTSPMTVTGIEAKCLCDNAVYNLFSGQSAGQQYPMKPYRVEMSGGNLIIYN
ncbi:hypothetical protein [Flavobacterium sp.]|uniref:hypothetical protein n=1 Tax=Flavobacterium sp. TaxID=239 RepID=UPI0025DA9AE7|nr:hypothetical protein [Flavobacterium sp.]